VHKQSLERHIRVVHEKAQTHACEHCDYRSAHRAALKMHVATVHDSKEAFRYLNHR
jgi:C2H2-type zinc-finger domain